MAEQLDIDERLDRAEERATKTRLPKSYDKLPDDSPLKARLDRAETRRVDTSYRGGGEQLNLDPVSAAEERARRGANEEWNVQNLAQQRSQQRLDTDFEALRSSKPEDVQDWQTIAHLTVELGRAEDKDSNELKDALLWAYGDELQPHLSAVAGDKWFSENYVEPPEAEDTSKWGWRSKLASSAPFFNYLDQWKVATLGGIAGLRTALDQGDDVSAWEGVKHAGQSFGSLGDIRRVIPGVDSFDAMDIDGKLNLDQDGDGDIGTREALGIDADAGGKWGGALDLIGQIALDPTTYLSFGTAPLARLGLKGAEEIAEKAVREGTAEIIERAGKKVTVDGTFIRSLGEEISKDGLKKLEPEIQRLLERYVREGVNQGIEGSGRSVTRFGNFRDDKALRQLARGGQSGPKFAGRTALSTKGLFSDSLGRGIERFKYLDEVIDAPVSKAQESIVTGTGQFGDDFGDLADGRLKQPKLPIDGVPGQRALDLDTPVFNRLSREAGTAQQGVMTWRNMGPKYEQVASNVNRIVETYDQRMIPGIKPQIPPPRVMQTILADTLKVMDDGLTVGGKLPPMHGPMVDEVGEMVLSRVVRDSIQSPGAFGKLLKTKPMQAISRRMSTFALSRALLGNKAADDLVHLTSIAKHDDPELSDILLRIGNDMDPKGAYMRSLKEFDSADDWERAINEAMSSETARIRALSDLPPASAKLVGILHDVRARLREVAIRGGMDKAQLHDLNTYLPRILTDTARKREGLMQQLSQAAADINVPIKNTDAITSPSQQARTIATDLDDLFATNKEALQVLKHAGFEDIDSLGKLFETNPVAAFAARARTAFATASEVDMLVGITKLDGNEGVKLAFRATPDMANKLSVEEVLRGQIKAAGGKWIDYKRVSLANGDAFMVHRTVASDMERVRMIFGDPRLQDDVSKFVTKMNDVWAASATVFGLNPAFHARNNIGNWFNMFLSGMKDPSLIARSAVLQKDMKQITNVMRETGETFEQAAKTAKIKPDNLQFITDARRMGILGDGRSIDILRSGDDSGLVGKGNKLNPISQDFVLNQPGVNTGQLVENNARLALFMDARNKGMSPEQAAQHVKKYLFDYSDLTRFESEKLRVASRFYTFMRKNTALQAYALVTRPARTANVKDVVEEITNMIGDEQEGQLPPWMPGGRIISIAGRNVAIQTDTPWDSFEEMMRIVVNPGTGNPLEDLGRESYVSGLVDRTAGLFSGFPASVVDFVEETRSNSDSFTGRPLDPDNQIRDKFWWRAMLVPFPGLGRQEKILAMQEDINAYFGIRLDEDGNPKAGNSNMHQLLNMFTGLQMYEIREDAEGQGRYVLTQELETMLRDMRDAGIDAPTVEEMRASGELDMKNRVAETLLYGWRKDADGTITWDDDNMNGELLQLLPKDLRGNLIELGILTEADEAMVAAANRLTPKGGRPDVVEGSAGDIAQQTYDFEQGILALETYLERDLTDDERWAVASSWGGALSASAQEETQNVNPYRDNSLMNVSKTEAEKAADLEYKTNLQTARLAAVGLTWDEVREKYPRITTFEKKVAEAREAGWSEEEIIFAATHPKDEGGMAWLSRNDIAQMNQFQGGNKKEGPLYLSLMRQPITDNEYLGKLQERAWDSAGELRTMHMLMGWPTPTQEQLFIFGMSKLTKGEQRSLGYEPLDSAASRKDIRTDEMKYNDAVMKEGAVRAGLAGPPPPVYRWEYNTP